ncbi:putative virulence factor, partial [Flavobacteriaceae bacterium]|nr:putative virulence factor [Flavobacteriaceae bacterium]
DTYSWLTQWTITKPNFQNIFLLRDFDKSSETNSQIFKGYNDYREEKEEIIPESYTTFRSDLKKSFVEYDFVKKHFEDPFKSWDSSASINQDGTKLIIEKLTIAAENINSARVEKIANELDQISDTIHSELLKHFHSNDKDKELQKAKSIAGDIQFKLDTAFRADGIKLYGQLMKELMINEGLVRQIYRDKIDDIEHRAVVDLDIYSTYRQNVPVEEGETVESYFDRLCIHYEKISDEQKQLFRLELESKDIDLEELIDQNSDLIKNNSLQLAEFLLEYWLTNADMNDKKTIQQILGFDGSSALEDLLDMFQKIFKKIGLAKSIAEKIRRYTDGNNKTGMPYDIIADISAELLNKCINSVGLDYFNESEITDLHIANENNNLGLELEQHHNPTDQSVSQLFEKIDNWNNIIQSQPEQMKSLPSYRNYLLWRNNLKVGFVSVCDIPNYDIEANKKLDAIIKEFKAIN